MLWTHALLAVPLCAEGVGRRSAQGTSPDAPAHFPQSPPRRRGAGGQGRPLKVRR